MEKNATLLEKTVAEIRTMNKEQIAELRAEVADNPSLAEKLETVLRIVALDKLIDAIEDLPFERRSQALAFATKALKVVSELRAGGATDRDIRQAVHKIFEAHK